MSSKSAIGRFFGAIWTGVDGIRKVLHLLLLLSIFLVFIGAISGSAPTVVPAKAALLIQPVGALVEQIEGDPYERAVADLLGDAPPQTLVQNVIDALDHAKDDDRIAVVHLELSALGGAGLSKLQRIGKALQAFRESGKTVVASADFYSQPAYYLGAHADELYMHPQGIVFLQGYGSFGPYFKDAIDKLLIDWNVFKVGTHKSFVEPFTRTGMSEEDRETRTRLTGQLWSMYLQDVETARSYESGSLKRFVDDLATITRDNGGDLAAAALENSIVDALMTRTELRDLLKGHAGEDAEDASTYSSISMSEYLSHMTLMNGPEADDENVAVVVASGNIVDGSQPPGTIGGDSTAALLREALHDDSVKAVVLRVDSGGGSVFASEVIAHAVRALQNAGKPVVASMSSVAASGGYWISAPADRIFASPATITGSIGVIGMVPTYQRSLAALGVSTDGVGTTVWSDQLRGDREMSPEMKQILQMRIEDTYDDFVSGVAGFREMEKQAVDAIAQGQVWTGSDALANGLIDELGTIDDAVAAAAELAGLEEGDYGRTEIAPRLSPTEQMVLDLLSLAGRAGIDPAAFAPGPSAASGFVQRIERSLAELASFNDPAGVYSHCFCEID